MNYVPSLTLAIAGNLHAVRSTTMTTLISVVVVVPLLVLIVGLTLMMTSQWRRLQRRPPYPPGPRGIPIIGNILTMEELTHRGLANMARKYGGLFHLRMGKVHVVVVSSSEYAKQVLQVQDSVFSNRTATVAVSYLTYNRADLVFANYGPFWRQMRKIVVIKLFSRKLAESWKSVEEEVEKLVQKVAGSTGTAMNIGEQMFLMTRDITYRAAFGTAAYMDGELDEFIPILMEFSKLFVAFNIADFIPWLGWMDLQGINGRLVEARRSLDKFIDRIMEDHMEKKKNNGVKMDMVDELLTYYTPEGAEEQVEEYGDLQIRLSKDNIKAIIMDIMFGGAETVASVTEWAMAELLRNPEDLERVQKELADVVGLDRRVEETDLEKLVYLKCILKETLRLHPPIPLLPHEAAEDSIVSGYFVPAKTRVLINVWAIGRDSESWEDPETFKPSRFLTESAPDLKGSNFEFLPFGSGRRSCPGLPLALYTLELAVANLLHCFTWELPGGMTSGDIDMSDVFGITTPRAVRLVAVPTPRLSAAALY